MPTIPTLNAPAIEALDQVTVDFLRKALSISDITSFSASKIGTGQVGEVFRLSLNYDATPCAANPDRPATVILKLPSSNSESRATAVSIRIYEHEARFYAEIAPLLPQIARQALPACFHAGFNPETGLSSFLLEDAGTGAIVGDDIRGSTREQALLAMRTLGLMQAALRPVLIDADKAAWLKKASWLIREPEATQAFFQEIFICFEACYESQMAPEHLEICQRWIPALGWWIEQQLTASPDKIGIIHNDYRLDNLLFTVSGGLKVVDWQTIMTGPLVSDIAYFLACSLNIENRRAWQDELLGAYCDALSQSLPPGFGPALTFEQVNHELRLQTLGILATFIISSQMVNRTDRGDDMFMTLIARQCELIKDTNALQLLPKLVPQDPTPLRPFMENEYPHPIGFGKHWNESWYFDFSDEGHGIAGWIRLAITPRMEGNLYTTTITQKGKGVYQIADYYAPDIVSDEHGFRLAKPESYDVIHGVTAGEELKTYKIKMSTHAAAHYRDADDIRLGTAAVSTSQSVNLNLSYNTAGIPYHYRILSHYEVPCTVTGSLVINGREIALKSAYGHREHKWGARDWCASDWIWAAFYLPAKHGNISETKIHASQLRWPGRTRAMGYVQTGDGIQEIENLECEEIPQKHSSSKARQLQTVTGMKMKLLARDKEEISVNIEPQAHAPLNVETDDGRLYKYDRAWAKVRASDGREGAGWFEWTV